MILPEDDTKRLLDSDSSSYDDPVAGPSTFHAPAYETHDDSFGKPTFSKSDPFVAPGGEEPPPEFTPYEAEFFKGSYGEIISHDAHLNEDGEALYRFILAHAQRPPIYLVRIHGHHTERRAHQVPRTDKNGNVTHETEWRTVDVTDFHFYIDVGQYIAYGPVHFSLADEEPAYRGKMFLEVDSVNPGHLENSNRDLEVAWVDVQRRKATSAELKRAKTWRKEQQSHGLPPWIGPDAGWDGDKLMQLDRDHVNVMKSSRTLRQWADEYCASKRRLKEFTYEKVVYGWDTAKLKDAILTVIHTAGYHSTIEVEFELTEAQIHVRPDNRLARMLSNKWWKFLLVITLVYPFIWLYKRFSAHGGGKWEVCGGAYALKAWRPSHTATSEPQPAGGGRVVESSTGGRLELVGIRESEWFQQWEGLIRQAVRERRVSDAPIVSTDGRIADSPVTLRPDGLRPYEVERD